MFSTTVDAQDMHDEEVIVQQFALGLKNINT